MGVEPWRTAMGRTADLAQLALALGTGPLFSHLERAHPALVHRTRHEPFAARGETFVRMVGSFEKAAFVAKMLGTDGDLVPSARPVRVPPSATSGGEVLFAGDALHSGSAAMLSDRLRERIAKAEAFVFNLEGTVGDRGHAIAPLQTLRGIRQLRDYARAPENPDWVSRFDAAALRQLASSCARVCASVANNHTLDDGPEGFAQTVSRAVAAGLRVVGDARRELGVATLDLGAHRVGLFAMSYGSNRGGTDPCHLRFDAVPYRVERQRVEELVRSLRTKGASHVVALLHWGHEHEHHPTKEQRACADRLFEAGVSAIVGHHPHLLQPSEQRDGRWVSWSLGDFVGGDRTIWSRFAGMVSLRFGAHGRVEGEVVPVVQAPFWEPQRTSLLSEAPWLERAVFRRHFATKMRAGGAP